MRFPAEYAFGCFLSLGHSCHSADKYDLVDLAELDAGILYARFARRNAAFDELVAKFFELCAAKRHLKMQRAALVHRDERQVDVRAHA
ncbi:hypothetical protein SDC9_185729 [bioreactor metagenome]|uniref:Uncharacterized protein n=1 Tax=bioreactor metagenome TaxID=1076179 RepID=A0A645HGN3_9ZZZZ